MLDPEPTISSRRIYEGRVVHLRVDTVQLPSSRTTNREIVEHGGVVCIVAIDNQDQVLLVRQYRKPVEAVLLEIPAGGIDKGEDPQASARRELLEETGWTAKHFEPLSTFYMSPGHCTELMYAFLATGLTSGEAQPEEDEEIEVVQVPLDGVSAMIQSGEIRDAKTITSLLMVLHLRSETPAG